MLGVAGSVTNSCDITHKLVSNQGSAIFDGTNDFIDASSVASDLSMTTGTVSLWARVTTTSNNESFFNISDGTSGSNKFSIFYLTSSAILRGNYKFGSTTVNVEHSISNSDIVAAGWFHVALTYDTSANSLILYFNGTAVATSTTSLTAIDTGSVTIDRVYLGKNSNADNTFHQGYIDEYAYFARVLTASEISDIHAAKGLFNYAEDLSLVGTANQLKQWLRFGDGSVQGTKDQTTGIIDMSNPTLGSELVVNGDFATDSDWDKGANWTIANNLATSDGSQTGNVSLFQLNSVNNFVTGKIYKVEFTISNYVAGVINPHIRGQASGNVSGNGLKTAYITAGGTSHGINLYAGSTFAGSISNVTAKQIQGNPAFVSGALINQNNLPG